MTRKSEVQPIRMTPEEKRLLAMGAKLSGLSVSSLLVSSAVKEVRRLMEEQVRHQSMIKKAADDDWRKDTLKSDSEKLKFVAEGLGVNVEDLKKREAAWSKRAKSEKGRQRLVIQDLIDWSVQNAVELEAEFGKIPTDEQDIAKFAAKVKRSRR